MAQMLVDQGVQQTLQPLSFASVGKDPMPQLGAIQFARWVKDVRAEVLCDRRERGLPGFDDNTAGDVCVNDGDLVFCEPVGRGRLAATDSARQADEVGTDVRSLAQKKTQHIITKNQRDPAGESQKRSKRDRLAAGTLPPEKT